MIDFQNQKSKRMYILGPTGCSLAPGVISLPSLQIFENLERVFLLERKLELSIFHSNKKKDFSYYYGILATWVTKGSILLRVNQIYQRASLSHEEALGMRVYAFNKLPPQKNQQL